MTNSESNTRWHRITLHAPDLTYGKHLSRFLKEAFGDRLEGRRVLVYEAEGGGDPSKGIMHIGCSGISVSELTERLEYTNQLDWATFCFIRDLDEEGVRHLCSDPIAEVISKSDFTVRVIDDSYLDIFTIDQFLRDTFIQTYVASEAESSLLSEMVFPG